MKPNAAKYNQAGNKLLEQGKYVAAEKQFRKATKAAPKWSVPWYNLGLVFEQWGAERMGCQLSSIKCVLAY